MDDLYSTAGGAKYAAEQIPGARVILFPTADMLGSGMLQWSVMRS
jgi:hypothetical protein